MTVVLVISLPKNLYIHCICVYIYGLGQPYLYVCGTGVLQTCNLQLCEDAAVKQISKWCEHVIMSESG
jgi:hypothetical protein